MELQTKVAVVTGAGRGIGKAIAVELARKGMRVALLSKTAGPLEKTSAEIRKEGGTTMVFQCDISEEAQVGSAFARVGDEWGGIYVLVNNAGVFLKKPLEQIQLNEWEKILKVNLTGPFLCTREAVRSMKRIGHGAIINISSNSGIQGYPDQSAYCASKHGLMGMARALALETKSSGIKVHNICPGGVDTEFTKGAGMHFEGQTLLKPRDIAKLCVFLLEQEEQVDIQEIIVRRFHKGK